MYFVISDPHTSYTPPESPFLFQPADKSYPAPAPSTVHIHDKGTGFDLAALVMEEHVEADTYCVHFTFRVPTWRDTITAVLDIGKQDVYIMAWNTLPANVLNDAREKGELLRRWYNVERTCRDIGMEKLSNHYFI